ncbi:MAG TPA: trehalose-6-phosphate synthase, partial [Nitrospira sp.]|nr:trehalose-6-phosphate synthase [Nitrospira sp.]
MRLFALSLRFVLPLVIVLAVIAYGVVPVVDSLELKWFIRDLDMRSKLMVSTMGGPLADLLVSNSTGKISAYFTRIIQDERLFAVGFCDLENRLLYETQAFPQDVTCQETLSLAPNSSDVRSFGSGPMHIMSASIESNGRRLGRLLLLHDMRFIQQRSSDTKRYVFYVFAALTAIISLVTLLIAHFSWKEWVAGVRAMVKGERLLTPLTQEQ